MNCSSGRGQYILGLERKDYCFHSNNPWINQESTKKVGTAKKLFFQGLTPLTNQKHIIYICIFQFSLKNTFER